MANIELVKIEMSKSTMRMSFSDDNIEMMTSENIKLTNNGNASAKFNWILLTNNGFKILLKRYTYISLR